MVFKLGSSKGTLSEDDPKLKLVSQIMSGVHLAAAAEAMSLGAKVGLDTKTLYEIISTAAGTSWMFVDRAPQMLSGKWTTKRTIETVVAELVSPQRPSYVLSNWDVLNWLLLTRR